VTVAADAGTLGGGLLVPLPSPDLAVADDLDAGAGAEDAPPSNGMGMTTPPFDPGPSVPGTPDSGPDSGSSITSSQSARAGGGGCAIASRGLPDQTTVLVGLGMALALLVRRRSNK
jgi:hypothetical protein